MHEREASRHLSLDDKARPSTARGELESSAASSHPRPGFLNFLSLIELLLGCCISRLRGMWRARGGSTVRPRRIQLESLEPRLLLSADLVYAELDNQPADFTDIPAYVAGLLSTNFTLRAEQDAGNFYWRLYGNGTDVLPIPATEVLEYQITQASDLDVNITRDDLGLSNGSISLIDFVGDRLTIDLDSLSVLNGLFGGTAIDIDFAGGKDIDLGNILGIVIPSPLDILNDQVILAGNGSGGAVQHALTVHSSSDIADDAAGAVVTVNGDVTMTSDSKIVFDSGASITATNISLLAEATGEALAAGLLANATAEVTLNGATLVAIGGTIKLSAHGKVDMDEDGNTFFDNTIDGTFATSFSAATVNVVGATTINAANLDIDAFVETDITATVADATVKILSVWAAGDPRITIGDPNVAGVTAINLTGTLDAEAKTQLKIAASSQPGTGSNDSSLDAAAVNVNVVDVAIPVVVPSGFTSGADLTVSGNAQISAAGGAMFKATDVLDIATTADGNVADTAGATFALTIIDSDTTVALTGNAAVIAPTVGVIASTTRTVATSAKSTPGGANDDNNSNTNNPSQQGLSGSNASTSDGDVTIAAAIALGFVDGTTNARVDSAAVTAFTGTTMNVGATATDTISAVAEGTTTGNTGLAIAVAVNSVDVDVNASLGGTLNLQATTVNVNATLDAENTYLAEATSGAGAQDVGIAGSLAINRIQTSARAFVDNGAAVTLNGGALNISATATTKIVTTAKPDEDGITGESLGLGASVAMSLVSNFTEAAVENGAAVSGGSAVMVAATGDHELVTTATMGASGGNAITPVVALTFADNTTRVLFETGSAVSATGNIDAEAKQDVDIKTEGKGDAEASESLALGAVLAYTSASDIVAARTQGSLTTSTGSVGLKGRSHGKSSTKTTASASGASNKGKNVDEQGDAQKSAAQSQGGTGSSKSKGSAKTTDGPIAVAAAISITVNEADVSVTVGNGGAINAANGTVTLSSLANQDVGTIADGQAVKAGSVGVGAAAAVTRADVVNVAEVQDGGSVSADGITIEAGMRDVSMDKQHAVTAQATSGAGSESGLGVAGAFALTIGTTEVRSGVASGGSVALADGTDGNGDAGELKITATEDAKNNAKAEPKVTADSFGLGASVAFAVATHEATAAIGSDAAVTGAKDVTLQTKTNLDVDSEAKAGVKAGVALSPVVAVSLVENATLARLGGLESGSSTLTGNLSITSEHTGNSESHAAGSVESTDAAIGLSIAVTETEEQTYAQLERSVIVGGNITVESKGLHDASADARSTATGAKDKENDNSNKNVDKKSSEQIKEVETKKTEAGAKRKVKKDVPAPPNAGDVEFETAKFAADQLDATERELLDSYADYLKEHTTSVATVTGFTDTVGGFEDNLALGKKRAETVRQYLIDQGVAASQIRILWVGETNLDEPTGNGVPNQSNRRAEVAVTAPDATVHAHEADEDSVLDDETILFAVDKDILDDGGYSKDDQNTAKLDAFAQLLLDNPNLVATVAGHTSTTATNDYNLGLSMRRANRVADYLKTKGVSESQLRVAWYGETDLEEPTANNVEHDDNRRVELYLVTTTPPVEEVEDPPSETVSKKPTSETHQDPGGGGNPNTEQNGAVAVAAAFALDLATNDTAALIGGDSTIVAQGTVIVRSSANTNAAAFADGGAVTTEGGTTVGAAVAINAAETNNTATIAAANVTADGMTVEAVMLERVATVNASEPQTVDIAANTIFVGNAEGLVNGEKVKYTAGGGTALQGLTDNTDYYVIVAGGGKIKLATTMENALAGTAIDLQSQGAGDAHKLDRDPADDITFDPDKKRVEFALAEDLAWVTGEAVEYDNDGNPDIGSGSNKLTDGTTYFVIADPAGKIKLAATREKALAGEAIPIDPGGGTTGKLKESVHGGGAMATSGASGGKYGVAGSVAVNVATGATHALLGEGAALTAQDGSVDGDANIGAIAVNAANTTYNVATATPKSEPASGKSLGLGLSFAFNVSDVDTLTTMSETAAVLAADDVSFIANANYSMATQAKAGAKAGSSGTAFAGAVALGVALNNTSSIIAGEDPETAGTVGALEVEGDLTVTATGLEVVRAEADADTKGAETGIGIAIGLNWIADDPDVTLARSVSSGAAQADNLTLAAASGTAVATMVSGAARRGARRKAKADRPPTRRRSRRPTPPRPSRATTASARRPPATRLTAPTPRPAARPPTPAGREAPRRTPLRSSREARCAWRARWPRPSFSPRPRSSSRATSSSTSGAR